MVDIIASIVNETLRSMNELKQSAQSEPPTFKPNKNLGEGHASDRNLEYRQALLTLLKDEVYTPMQKLMKTNKSVDDKIKALDSYIDNYITKGQKLVTDYLTKAYQNGVDEATTNLKRAAKKQDAKYKPKVPKNPAKLQQLIVMGKQSIEDYGLTLRGRLRSAIQTASYMNK